MLPTLCDLVVPARPPHGPGVVVSFMGPTSLSRSGPSLYRTEFPLLVSEESLIT
jgi:hypothetical protein